MSSSKVAHSKVTAQGQISVPAEVRKKLGIGPGSTLEWTEEGGNIVVRRSGRYNWQDVRTALFGEKLGEARSLDELKVGLRRHIRRKHARD
jgi:AbrB family looped-hinge helix DNA binding protein